MFMKHQVFMGRYPMKVVSWTIHVQFYNEIVTHENPMKSHFHSIWKLHDNIVLMVFSSAHEN